MTHIQNKSNTATTQHTNSKQTRQTRGSHMEHTVHQQKMATPKLETHTKHQKTPAATHIDEKERTILPKKTIERSYIYI